MTVLFINWQTALRSRLSCGAQLRNYCRLALLPAASPRGWNGRNRLGEARTEFASGSIRLIMPDLLSKIRKVDWYQLREITRTSETQSEMIPGPIAWVKLFSSDGRRHIERGGLFEMSTKNRFYFRNFKMKYRHEGGILEVFGAELGAVARALPRFPCSSDARLFGADLGALARVSQHSLSFLILKFSAAYSWVFLHVLLQFHFVAAMQSFACGPQDYDVFPLKFLVHVVVSTLLP